jgi:hypothetical protein
MGRHQFSLTSAAAFGLPLIGISLNVCEFEPGKPLLGIGIAFTGLFRHLQPRVCGDLPENRKPSPGFCGRSMMHLGRAPLRGLSIPGFPGNWFNQATLLISGNLPS